MLLWENNISQRVSNCIGFRDSSQHFECHPETCQQPMKLKLLGLKLDWNGWNRLAEIPPHTLVCCSRTTYRGPSALLDLTSHSRNCYGSLELLWFQGDKSHGLACCTNPVSSAAECRTLTLNFLWAVHKSQQQSRAWTISHMSFVLQVGLEKRQVLAWTAATAAAARCVLRSVWHVQNMDSFPGWWQLYYLGSWVLPRVQFRLLTKSTGPNQFNPYLLTP